MKEKDGKWIEKARKLIKENTITVIVYWIVIFLIISIAFALCAMLNKEEFNSEGLGLFGDFFGGVIGTILTFASVIILAMTFKQQERVTKANLKKQDIQRFNDMFYELLRLYKEQFEELSNKGISFEKQKKKMQVDFKKEMDGEELSNKGNFFEEQKKKMQVDFKKEMDGELKKLEEEITENSEIIRRLYNKYKSKNESYDEFKQGEKCKKFVYFYLFKKNILNRINSKISSRLYMEFYVEHREKIAQYFRTLYRILDLIDTSPLLEDAEKDKKSYAKILRGQLTESELFFIRYNAMSIYRGNFVEYINKYRILKHLPVLELLEFQMFSNDDKKNSEFVNEIFYLVCEEIKKKEEKGYRKGVRKLDVESFIESFKDKLIIEGEEETNKEITIKYVINNTVGNDSAHSVYFEALEDIRKNNIVFNFILYCFMHEMFFWSNFNKYNKGAKISVRQSRCNNTEYIIYTIKSDNPIQIGSDYKKKWKLKSRKT